MSLDQSSAQTSDELIRIFGTIATRQSKLRQYTKAEAAYQEVLKLATQIKHIDENERSKLMAIIYHNLGNVADEQRQWAQAEQYYQQALRLKIELNDRYEQASTYHQLGRVAQEQRQWQQARDYFLTALKTFVGSDDTHNGGIVLRSLARLWQASDDKDLPAAVASILDAPVEEIEAWLRKASEDGSGAAGNA